MFDLSTNSIIEDDNTFMKQYKFFFEASVVQQATRFNHIL